MKLKNVLIVVSDMNKSIAFYKELFGLEVILDNDGNVIMTEGLVLQDKAVWEKFIEKDVILKSNSSELYFKRNGGCGCTCLFHPFYRKFVGGIS